MDRRLLPASILLLFISPVSAQITSGYGSTRSIPDMISHLFGINVYNPYEILGITATFGVLWVSTYVVFKVGIKRIDEGLNNNGRGDSGLQDALGVDDGDSRNVLSILTLLIVLTIIGTGAFLDVIRGWQSLIILAFLFALLAGLVFVIFGGAGAVIGGSAYAAGVGAQATASGVNKLKREVNRIGDMEDEVEEEEDEEEDDIDDGNEDDADDKARITAEELEQIVEMIDDTEEQLDDVIEELEEELSEEIESVRKLVELLGDEDE